MNIEDLIALLSTPANVAEIKTRGYQNQVVTLKPRFTSELMVEIGHLPKHAREHFNLTLVWDHCTVLMNGAVEMDRASEIHRVAMMIERQLITVIADGDVLDLGVSTGLERFEFGSHVTQFDPKGIKGATTLARFVREHMTVNA